jgi:hypothetical protein
MVSCESLPRWSLQLRVVSVDVAHLIVHFALDLQPIDEGQAKPGVNGQGNGGKKQPVTEPTLQLHEIRLDDRLLAALIKPEEASDQEAMQLRKWIDEWLHTKVRIEKQEVAAYSFYLTSLVHAFPRAVGLIIQVIAIANHQRTCFVGGGWGWGGL